MREAISFDTVDTDILQYNNIQQISRGTLITANIADLHFPNVISPQVQFSILDEQFLKKIENLPKLDLVTILGDLYDHKVLASSDAVLYATMFVSKVVEICKRKNATLIIIQGTISHDANQLKMYYPYMYDTSIDVRIVTGLKFEYVKNAKILCIPELYGFDESIYQRFLFGEGFYDMALMHGMFAGAVNNGGDNAGSSRLFHIEDFYNCRGPILSGHVHKPGCFKDHFYYCGSPYAWRFDDDHKKGFIMCAYNLDTSRYYIDWEEIRSFRYKTIHIDEIVNTDPQFLISKINKMKDDQGIDFIRIFFDVDLPKISKMIINNNYKENSHVVVEYQKTADELLERKREEELESNMEKFRFIMDAKIPDEEKFCIYVNILKEKEGWMTVNELLEILNDL